VGELTMETTELFAVITRVRFKVAETLVERFTRNGAASVAVGCGRDDIQSLVGKVFSSKTTWRLIMVLLDTGS
jgi:hypothetical protein